MLLYRMGSRYMFIRSEKVDEITNFLVIKLKGEIIDFRLATEKSTEHSTICFITGINHEKTYVEDAKKIVLVYDIPSSILAMIINSNECQLVHRIDMGPSAIIMRVLGNEQKLKDNLKEVFNAREVNLVEGIGLGERDDSIIIFTNKVLSGPVSDSIGTKLLIPQPAKVVQGRLRLEGLRFITQSLEDSQWYELRINIYDSTGKYKENYDRLMFVLEKLEVGMVLGESWTKDYAVILYSVMTYQVRLFTFFKPGEVKKILVALEYTKDGNRLVDFDLYYKNKKINWGSVVNTKGKKDKLEESKKCRQNLYEKLKPEDIKTLEEMER